MNDASIKVGPSNPIPIAAELARRESHTAKVYALFVAHPREWLNATVFMEVGGAFAWRTRISNARKLLERDGGVVENRQYRVGEQIVSEYRYLPYVPLASDASQYREQRLFV